MVSEQTVSDEKLKVVHLDVGGCEGCAVTVLRVLPHLERIAETYTKYTHDEIPEDARFDVALVTGSVCLNDEEAVERLRRLRAKVKVLIALGSCASVGGVTLFARGGQSPKPEHRVWQPISAVVEVDYAVPGCPPAPMTVKSLMDSLAAENKGAAVRRGQYFKRLFNSKKSQYFLHLFSSVARVRKLSGYDLLDDVVLTGLCVGCGVCVLSCPTNALRFIDRKPDLIPEKCIRCGTCYVRCPRASQVLIRRFPPNKLGEVVRA